MTQPVGYECPFDVSGSGLAAGPLVPTAPILELAVAGILFAGVLGLRLLFGSPVDAYSMLYALPIALVATTFGLRAGTFAGLLAVGLTVLWAMTQSVHLTPTGWASRVLPLLLLGVLLGHATDRERRAHEEHRRLEAAGSVVFIQVDLAGAAEIGQQQVERAVAVEVARRNRVGEPLAVG